MKPLFYTIRTLRHQWRLNVIKILSIGLGLTVCILLFSRVAFEQSFDRDFQEPDKLYQLWSQWNVASEPLDAQQQNMGGLSGGVYEALADEVEAVTSVGYWMVTSPLYYGNTRFDVDKVVADSLFFKTLGVTVYSGNPINDLTQNDVVFLSKSTAQQMFGDDDPIGKVITYDKTIELTVKGTYADIPENATIHPKAVISLPTIWSRNIGNYSWNGGDSWYGYVRLKENANIDILDKRIDVMVQQHVPNDASYGYTGFIKPIRDTYRQNPEVKRMCNIMLILGFAILFITALNYVLISISSLSRRAKAIGVHKCSGAGAKSIFGMFMLETAIIIFLSLIIVAIILFNFQDFVEDTVSASLQAILSLDRIWVSIAVILLLFLIGGVLPGYLFSKIPVTQVFRRYTEGKKTWKRPLLFIQFAGVCFIFCLLCIVILQYKLVVDKDPGYNAENVVIGRNFSNTYEETFATRDFYKSLPYVEDVTSATSYPSGGYSGEMIPDEQGKDLFSSRYDYATDNYVEFMQLIVKEGRVPRERGEVAINETFIEWMRWGDDVIGKVVKTEESYATVVGVLKDFKIHNFYSPPMPFILHFHPSFGNVVYLRLKEPFADNLKRLNEEAAERFPTRTVEFKSLKKMMYEDYNSIRVFRNAVIFAAITILLITLMGLIGYVNDELQRRSKEIAIRKVNGAEVGSILKLIVKDVFWVAVPAVIVGVAIAWYVGTIWMEQFTATITAIIPYYLVIALLVLCFILACILIKTWKIANENPVNSIKSE